MVLAVFLPPPPAAAGGKITKTSGQLANPSRSRVVKRWKKIVGKVSSKWLDRNISSQGR